MKTTRLIGCRCMPSSTNRPKTCRYVRFLMSAAATSRGKALCREPRRSEKRSLCYCLNMWQKIMGIGPKNMFPVAKAEGPYPIPSRTRKSSPPAPMVLGGRLPGRVGRRRGYFFHPLHLCAGGEKVFGLEILSLNVESAAKTRMRVFVIDTSARPKGPR